MSINRVLLSGNLTRDPELRATAGGTPRPLDRPRRQRPPSQRADRRVEDYPNFVDCSMFGTRAEAVSKHMQKGDKIAIEGKLRFTQWEKEGQHRTKLEVVIEDIEFMAQRRDQ